MLRNDLAYKSKDTEEYLDRLITRRVGYFIALFSAKVGLSPNMLTVISIITGLMAGYLFRSNLLLINIYGMILLIFSDWLDSSDGQLARMTGQSSKIGRILDGIAGNLIAISIYINLSIRMMTEGYSYLIVILTILSAVSHSIQASIADYYRNAYLYYVYGNDKSEFESSENILSQFYLTGSKSCFAKKLFIGFYFLYTRQQESYSKAFQIFHFIVNYKFKEIPDFVRKAYRMNFKSTIKYYNLMTINSRNIIIFVSLLLNNPLYYLLFEIVILNLVLLYVYIIHKIKFSHMSYKLLYKI